MQGPWQPDRGITEMQREPYRGRGWVLPRAHGPLEALGTVAASSLCLGENQTCKEGTGAATKGQRRGRQKAEGLPWPRRKRQAGKAEGKGRGGDPGEESRDVYLTRGILPLAGRSTG